MEMIPESRPLSLTAQARQFYADRRLAAKWVVAVRFLRSRHLWILDGAHAKWGNAQIEKRGESQSPIRHLAG